MPLPTTTRRCRTLMTILALGVVSAAPAAVINVPADQPTIQAGIDAAVDGDVVVVAPGTYSETINYSGRTITVRSEDPSDPAIVASTIIDGGGSGSVVLIALDEGAGTRLQGFTITNGFARDGAGVYMSGSSAVISDCVISGNEAGFRGGGILCDAGANAMVERCQITGNTAVWGGGAYHLGGSTVSYLNCSIEDNEADTGGGMTLLSMASASLHSCWFVENNAEVWSGALHNTNTGDRVVITHCMFMENTAGGRGGAITNESSSQPTVVGCAFVGNSAGQDGGGIANANQSDATITSCVFLQNTAPAGGAMSNQHTSQPVVSNCTFEGNSADSGGAIRNSPSCHATYFACTFRDNDAVQGGGGIYNVNAAPALLDCMFTGNTAADGGAISNAHGGSTPELTRCIFIDNVADSGGALGGTQASFPNVIDSLFFCNIPDAISTPYTDGGENRMVECGTGACCLGNNCIIANESACADAGGVYLGDASGCEGSCAPPCPGDTNGDGSVDFSDLISVLSAWGFCP